MDELEKDVALFLEDQQKMFFWYRNIDRKGYYLQGWQKHKVYPDFLFTVDENRDNVVDKIFVTEIKGDQLLGNDDSDYKQELLEMCNNLTNQKQFNELALELKDRQIKFEMIPQSA